MFHPMILQQNTSKDTIECCKSGSEISSNHDPGWKILYKKSRITWFISNAPITMHILTWSNHKYEGQPWRWKTNTNLTLRCLCNSLAWNRQMNETWTWPWTISLRTLSIQKRISQQKHTQLSWCFNKTPIITLHTKQKHTHMTTSWTTTNNLEFIPTPAVHR